MRTISLLVAMIVGGMFGQARPPTRMVVVLCNMACADMRACKGSGEGDEQACNEHCISTASVAVASCIVRSSCETFRDCDPTL